jgi:hypothetical protein
MLSSNSDRVRVRVRMSNCLIKTESESIRIKYVGVICSRKICELWKNVDHKKVHLTCELKKIGSHPKKFTKFLFT